MKHQTKYDKVKDLFKDNDNYISITYGNKYFKTTFKDSYGFLQAGITILLKSLPDEAFGLFYYIYSILSLVKNRYMILN